MCATTSSTCKLLCSGASFIRLRSRLILWEMLHDIGVICILHVWKSILLLISFFFIYLNIVALYPGMIPIISFILLVDSVLQIFHVTVKLIIFLEKNILSNIKDKTPVLHNFSMLSLLCSCNTLIWYYPLFIYLMPIHLFQGFNRYAKFWWTNFKDTISFEIKSNIISKLVTLILRLKLWQL